MDSLMVSHHGCHTSLELEKKKSHFIYDEQQTQGNLRVLSSCKTALTAGYHLFISDNHMFFSHVQNV